MTTITPRQVAHFAAALRLLKKQGQDAKFDETKHPRDHGRFTSGGSSGSKSNKDEDKISLSELRAETKRVMKRSGYGLGAALHIAENNLLKKKRKR